MSDEQESNPCWKPGALGAMETATITLESAKQIADGENSYGTWNLWAVNVTDATVFEGKKPNEKEVKNYTGKAVMFPNETLHGKFIEYTGGTKEGVKVEIKCVPKKGVKGFYTTYETQKMGEGATPEANVLDAHGRFLKDFKNFVDNKIVEGTKEDFVNFCKSDTYKIPEDSVDKLWAIYTEE